MQARPPAELAASASSPNPQEAPPLPGGSTKFAFAPGSGLSDAEAAAAQAAFRRFHVPHTSEIDKDDLYELVKYVGYPRVSASEVSQLAKEVTPYKEMDLDEVLSFLDRLTKHEYEIFRKAFAELCEEGSAQMDVSRLTDLMQAIGFTPHRMLIHEILSSMDLTVGHMEFDEVVEFLVAYRRTQGFSGNEVLSLRHAFECFEVCPQVPAAPSSSLKSARKARRMKAAAAIQPGLPLSALVEALTLVFGVHGEIFANRVISNMHGGDGLWVPSPPSHIGVGRDGGSPRNMDLLGFSEFLVLARRVREVELEEHRAAFDRYGGSSSTGRMPTTELQNLMRSLGYEPLWATLNEAMEEVGVAGSTDLSFEDFFHARLALEARDGLLKSEVEEFSTIFHTCDEDGSKSIDVIELDSVMRNMGYNLTQNDLHLLSDRVDVKRTGVLELPEFLRVMGMHREGELKRLRGIFTEHQTRSENELIVPKDRLIEAIEAATDGFVPKSLRKALASRASPGARFDAFVGLADQARQVGAASRRRNAGFKEAEIQHFRSVFDACDKDGSGEIDPMEVQGLLDTLGIKVRTREEQKTMMDKLDDARAAAREAGAKGVTPDGALGFGFWELVQLMRMLRKESDKEANELVERTAQELGFTPQEREQFRKIFIKWSRVDLPVDFSPGGCASPGQRGRAGPEGAPSGELLEEGLSMETFQRLIRSMGVRIKIRQREELERKALSFGTTDTGLLSFVGFLRMMRWLLDSDFAGINDVAASVAAQRSKRRSTMSPVLA